MMLDSPAESLDDAAVVEAHPLVTSRSATHDAAMNWRMLRIILEASTP